MFPSSALILHGAFAALLVAMIVGNSRARWTIAVAATAFGVQAYISHGGWIAVGWSGAIVAVGVFLAVSAWARNRTVRFSAEENAMRDRLLAGVSASAARHFIDRGYWISAQEGEALMREGEETAHLVYLSSGDAAVSIAGRKIATCHAGDLIGEASALTGDPASATVVLETPARFWCAEAGPLRAYITANEEVRSAIGRNFSQTLRMKLVETSCALALATV